MSTALEESGFCYDPLPDSKKFIRLIKVQAAKQNQVPRLSIQLETWLWEGDTLPPYGAISYTWGDAATTTRVSINGRRAIVRQNCEDAMIQATSHADTSFEYIWVDAICINQESNSEKSDQVAMMGQIYRRASRVFSCIGQHADDSKLLMQMLSKHRGLLTKISDKVIKGDYPFTLGTAPMRQRVLPIIWRLGLRNATVERLARASNRLLKREYFWRTWIKQELFMGRSITLCCGTEQIPFEVLHGLIIILTGPTSSSPFLDPLSLGDPLDDLGVSRLGSFFSRIWIMRRFVISYSYAEFGHVDRLKTLRLGADPDPVGTSLAIGLEQISEAKCCDPRDKVYGILSTIKWGTAQQLVPNYDLSRFKLAADVMRFFAENPSHAAENDKNEANATAKRVGEILGVKPGEESLKLELHHRSQSTKASESTQTWLDSNIYRCTDIYLGYSAYFDGVWRLHDETKLDNNDRPSYPVGPIEETFDRLSVEGEKSLLRSRLVYSHDGVSVVAIVPLSMRSGDFLVFCRTFDDYRAYSPGEDYSLRHLSLILRRMDLDNTTPASIKSRDRYSIVGQALVRWKWRNRLQVGATYNRFMMHFHPEDVVFLVSQGEVLLDHNQEMSSCIRARLSTNPCAFTNSSYGTFLDMNIIGARIKGHST